MGRDDAAEIARRLAQNAEAVCCHYLSNGRREGRVWRVGDVDNTPGRSMAVRLTGPDSGKGAAGHWTDFSTAEYGDLLDVIARTCRLAAFRDVLQEARRFLSLPQPEPHASAPRMSPAPSGSPEAARRLFASAKPIRGTIAETYLRSRGIVGVTDLDCLRFHPRCYYRAHDGAPRETWPALVAAVTDLDGVMTGVMRTWLARDGSGKGPLATPRRASIRVPQDKIGILLRKLEVYRDNDPAQPLPAGETRKRDNRRLAESISQVGRATLRHLWTDQAEDYPAPEQVITWEVWLHRPRDPNAQTRTRSARGREVLMKSTGTVPPAKSRLTTSAMIASIATEGQRTRPPPFGHALADLARKRSDVIGMTADLAM